MTVVFFDIETIPTQRADERDRIAAEVREHNASLKKPHADDVVEGLIDEAWRKTALDGAFGEVVAICADCPEHGETFARGRVVDQSERALLGSFFSWLGAVDETTQGSIRLVGHNAVGFDRPFLRQRALVLELDCPGVIARPLKPWDAADVDTMLMWTLGSYGKTISLAKLCRALGVDGKTAGMDGSKVWDLVREGRIDEVVSYCAADVAAVRACYLRMGGAM